LRGHFCWRAAPAANISPEQTPLYARRACFHPSPVPAASAAPPRHGTARLRFVSPATLRVQRRIYMLR